MKVPLLPLVFGVITLCHVSVEGGFAGERRTIGFDVGSHFRNEVKVEDGIEGEYGFETPDGCMHVVRYRAGKRGYKILGTSRRNCGGVPLPTTKRPTTTTPTTTTTTTTPTTTTTTTTTTTPPPTTTPKPTTTTTPKPTTTTRRSRPRNRGKELLETVQPPPDMKRPKVLSPDDPEPTYTFGFQTSTHGHTEAGLPDGSKKGEYYWDTPDGWRIMVTYEATKNGFHPKVRRFRLTTTTPAPPSLAKQLVNDVEPESNGCPYFFYTNTLISFHWERCVLNGTKVGEYGNMADDGFMHRVKYYADHTGYHPKVSKIRLTREQKDIVAGFTDGAFIIPKINEEKQDTEKRIQSWISNNQDRIDDPL